MTYPISWLRLPRSPLLRKPRLDLPHPPRGANFAGSSMASTALASASQCFHLLVGVLSDEPGRHLVGHVVLDHLGEVVWPETEVTAELRVIADVLDEQRIRVREPPLALAGIPCARQGEILVVADGHRPEPVHRGIESVLIAE